MSVDLKEILRIYWQGVKANADLALEMLEKGSPSEQPRESAKSEPKEIVASLNELAWLPMPATETNKGAWEKCLPTEKAPYPFIVSAIEAKNGRPVYIEGFIVWLNEDKSLGRRRK